MKAVVFHGVGDVRLEDVKDPKLSEPTDAIVRLTASAICGTDLHFVRGTVAGMKAGTILGHEGVGVVEEVGKGVRNLTAGDRVVVCSTIGCGACSYCRAGYFSQCDVANPNGPAAGTCFFGGPAQTGPIDGLQAEYARIPFAHVTCVKLPPELTDDQAILLSDIAPTGYFGVKLAEVRQGDTVAVFGCGPVGQFAIMAARLLGAGRIIAVDTIATRLALARAQGAEIIDYEKEDPIEAIRELTNGIGVDRVIDAVGVDANRAHSGPAAKQAKSSARDFEAERQAVAPKTNPDGDNFQPGDAPSQVLRWAVEAVAKAGTVSIIGVYPEAATSFPIGKAMNKNLTLNMGNCNHRRYVPELVDMVRTGRFEPTRILSHTGPLLSALDAYRAFDRREAGWIKVELEPQSPGNGEAPEARPVVHS